MRKVASRLSWIVVVVAVLAAQQHSASAASGALAKIDALVAARTSQLFGRTRVVVRGVDGVPLSQLLSIVQLAGGSHLRVLPILNGCAVDVPNLSLLTLALNPLVARLSYDRVVAGSMERTGATVGASAARAAFGYDGAGVGVAVIDSGVFDSHDDLGGAQHVAAFADFVNGRTAPYDDYGHGTHVAGIVAGSGFDSGGARSGLAPGAHLVVLKALDRNGRGRISDVIAALDYAVAHKDDYNIRVANLSIATGVTESYTTDPLTLAAKRAVEAGIVVVAAAGNNGRDAHGRAHYGGVTAPGNAPWVLTVGASSHMGTVDRGDDTVAAFSSRGPAAVDFGAKPDLVAPGVGIESLSDPDSALYASRSAYLLNGTVATPYLPYLSLSGTSMAAPVVAGTVALMLQANPSLTPNEVKAILQFTAEAHPDLDPLTQGGGFLNARGAVELARHFAAPDSIAYPATEGWSARLVWGNQLVAGGRLTSTANAWAAGVTWGAASDAGGADIEWGVICADETCGTSAPWRMTVGAASWNVVWGSACAGADCERDIWGASDGDTVVWGTNDGDTVVWGTSDGDTVVWGTSCSDPSCEPVLWNR